MPQDNKEQREKTLAELKFYLENIRRNRDQLDDEIDDIENFISVDEAILEKLNKEAAQKIKETGIIAEQISTGDIFSMENKLKKKSEELKEKIEEKDALDREIIYLEHIINDENSSIKFMQDTLSTIKDNAAAFFKLAQSFSENRSRSSSDASTTVEKYDENNLARSDSIASNETEQTVVLSFGKKIIEEQTENINREIWAINEDKQRYLELKKQESLLAKEIGDLEIEKDKFNEIIGSIETKINTVTEKFNTSSKVLENKKQEFGNAQENEKSLTPSNFLGRAVYFLQFVFARLTFGQTKLEKARAETKKAESDLNEIRKSHLDLQQSAEELLNSLEKKLSELSEISKKLTEKSSKLSEISAQLTEIQNKYGNKELSEKAFDNRIEQITSKLQTMAKENITKEKPVINKLIESCDYYTDSMSMTREKTYDIRMSLKKFLESPTVENLNELNKKIGEKISASKHDDNVLNLIEKARQIYPDIVLPGRLEMAQTKIQDYYHPELSMLAEDIFNLKKEIEAQSDEISHIDQKIANNISSLWQCYNLMRIAKHREKEYRNDPKLQHLEQHAQQLVSYLEKKQNEILNQLPQEEKEKQKEIIKKKGEKDEPILNIVVEDSHKEIIEILNQYKIQPPKSPFTLNKIQEACAHLAESEKKSFLSKIESIPLIKKQMDQLNSDLIKYESAVFGIINHLDPLLNSFDDFLTKNHHPKKISDIFTEFANEPDLNKLKNALDQHKQEYPELNGVISEIDKLPNIENFLGKIQALNDEEKSIFQKNIEKMQKNIEIRNQILQLESKKELLVQEGKQNIENKIAPATIFGELKTVLEQCKGKTTVEWKALAKVIESPSEKNLDAFVNTLDSSQPLNADFITAMKTVGEYYPAVISRLTAQAQNVNTPEANIAEPQNANDAQANIQNTQRMRKELEQTKPVVQEPQKTWTLSSWFGKK